jgi:hypothetical protein
MVSQGTVRMAVMGMSNAAPSPSELEAMKAHVEAAMQSGARGMCSGLRYVPSGYASIDELVELASVVKKYGGVYASHIRSEGDNGDWFSAIDEALAVGRGSGVPVQISHLKALGTESWGKSAQALSMITDAMALGIDVMCDQYPYEATSSTLSQACRRVRRRRCNRRGPQGVDRVLPARHYALRLLQHERHTRGERGVLGGVFLDVPYMQHEVGEPPIWPKIKVRSTDRFHLDVVGGAVGHDCEHGSAVIAEALARAAVEPEPRMQRAGIRRQELANAQHGQMRPPVVVGRKQQERESFTPSEVRAIEQQSHAVRKLVTNRSGHS